MLRVDKLDDDTVEVKTTTTTTDERRRRRRPWGWHDSADVGLARQRQRGAGKTMPTWGWHDNANTTTNDEDDADDDDDDAAGKIHFSILLRVEMLSTTILLK